MATVDLRDDGANSTTLPAHQQQTFARLHKRLDFSSTGTGRTAADVLQLFRLPARTLFTVVVDVATAEGGTFTFDVKTDENTPQTLMSNADGNVAGVKMSDGSAGTGAGLLYAVGTSACNLTLTVDHTVDAAILGVTVIALSASTPAITNDSRAST